MLAGDGSLRVLPAAPKRVLDLDEGGRHGLQEMLREEYGDEAAEERRSSGAVIGASGPTGLRGQPPLIDVSEDGILGASEDELADDGLPPGPAR
jgi:hypothetical protein